MNTQSQNPLTNGGAYLKAKQSAFAFHEAATQYDDIESQIEESQQKKKQSFMVILAFICITVAFILGYIQATNLSSSIIGAGNNSEGFALAVGIGLTFFGLLIGEKLTSEFVKDEFTGKKKPTATWYMALIGAIAYVGLQFAFTTQASIGADESMSGMIVNTQIIGVCISLIELLFGGLFVKRAVETVNIFFMNIRRKLLRRKLKQTATQTENYWQRFLYEISHSTNSDAVAETTPAIERARSYYNNGGFEFEQ